MMMIKYIFIIFVSTHCEEEQYRKTLPFSEFRRQVEGSFEDAKDTSTSDANIVSFFVKNVKEILFDNEMKLDGDSIEMQSEVNTEAVSNSPNVSYLQILNMNLSRQPTKHNKTVPVDIVKDRLLNSTKDAEIIEKTAREKNVQMTFIKNSVLPTYPTITPTEYTGPPKRSCIKCDNTILEDCVNPVNKVVPTITCDRQQDLCYSQHTPFGLVDRGCFNVNHNITTYVCSCNLCNYLAISGLSVIFSTKQDWKDNVIEMSRTKRFRRTILKKMSCLKCEVKMSTKTGDDVDRVNCLEGNMYRIQECKENEICAVRARRSEGYLWRGCATKPLFNYWFGLCDTDICNHDKLISIFDI
ncbi:uncharacterized protein LOC126971981 [Leptidea sinapis]|uniref:uncharacterized protein LOC126971981 n=1 Tax=Leptidea sinapis TaxID=189913 RepID=UPI0021C45E26|nr:uncharacterized protein LOC126971981 [Leptidea sinapis]